MSGSFYFDPDGKGLTVFLGPTEARLMEMAWKHGPLTVKKAIFLWQPPPKPAYTTIMTILSKLADKGLLSRSKDDRSFVYGPVSDRARFLQERVARVSTCLRTNFPESFKAPK